MNADQFNITAFHGGPKTLDYLDEHGVPTIEVKPSASDPFWIKVANGVGLIILVPSILLTALHLLNSQGTREDWIGAAMFLVPVWLIVGALMRSIQTVKRHVKFTPTALMIKRRRFPFGHYWEIFELNQPVRFTMIPHDRALWEREHNEYLRARAQTNRKAIKPATLYQNSHHVCLEHFGQRHDVITAFGRKDATAILTRLKACLEINKARAGKSGSTATEPAQQWKPTPGSLPALPPPDPDSKLH